MTRFYTTDEIFTKVRRVNDVPETASEANRIIAKWCFCNNEEREIARVAFWFFYGIQF